MVKKGGQNRKQVVERWSKRMFKTDGQKVVKMDGQNDSPTGMKGVKSAVDVGQTGQQVLKPFVIG
jgi:hypothetical protein